MDEFLKLIKPLKPYRGRLVFTALGFISAILFLTLGFIKTAVILLCCGIGYALGVCMDKGLTVPERLLFWRNKW